MKLRLPLRDIFVTQPYWVNWFDFYQQMGLPYHPWVDFRARSGCKLYPAADGIIINVGKYSDGWIGIEIKHNDGYSTFYYHLREYYIKIWQEVKIGDVIWLCDNTGKYTNWDHLHFELRLNWIKVNPAWSFYYSYDGAEIWPKDWDKSRCYHRYYRGRPKGGLVNEAKILSILTKKGIWPTIEKINALVYWGWDLPSVINPAMYEIYSQLKKDEYLEKKLIPFN